MSEIFENGYKEGEASYGKEKMSDFEGSQRKDEFMAGYCLARAEDDGAGTNMVYYALGRYAGYYGLPEEAYRDKYDLSHDYDGLFESGYDDGQEERHSSNDEDDYE